MSKVVVVVEPEKIDVDGLRKLLDIKGCGSIVSFVGLTRGEADGVEVERLEFDAWEEELPSALQSISIDALGRFGANSVVIAHRIVGDMSVLTLPMELLKPRGMETNHE